jgi:hypothetical protein
MTKEKYIKLFLLFFSIGYILIEANGRGDLFIFLSASDDLFKGENIFSKTYVDGYHYLYSVFFAILIKPLTFLPLYFSNLIWLGLNLYFLIRVLKQLSFYTDLSGFSTKEVQWFKLLCFLFSLRFIHDNFHLTQMTIFLLFVVLEGMACIRNQKVIKGALLLALGINIKLLPLVILPYLLWRKEFKAFIYCIGFCTLFLFIPGLLIGFKHNQFLLFEWWLSINPTNQNHVIDVSERSFHSLSTLFPTLLMEKVPDTFALPLRRNMLDVPVDTVNLILNITRLFLVGFTLYFLRTFPFVTFRSRLKTFWELSYILLLIPLIFPHQQYYAFLFSMPATTYLLYYLYRNKSVMSKNRYATLVALLIVIYLCFNLNLILGEFKPYYEHYKIITYGALFLIPVLAVCKPEHIEISTS